jgi:hypothetical protein
MDSKTVIHGAGPGPGGPGVTLDEDRISTLPDHLLQHILSFMRTHDAIRTSVLSPRWRHVWTGIPTFAFSLSGDTARLADSVDKVLALSRSHHVDVLDISIRRPLHMARANVWLQQAVERVHGNISISFFPSAPAADPIVLDLPCGGRTRALSIVFSDNCIGTLRVPPASSAVSSSLTELKLKFLWLDGSRFSDCVSSCCPHLRKLILHTVGDVDPLRLCNDALEDVDLDSAPEGCLQQLQVSSRNLRRLRINILFSPATRFSEVHDGSKVASFRTPRLEDLVWNTSASMHPSRVEFADSLATVRRLDVMLFTHAWVDDADFYHNKLTVWLLQHCSGVRRLEVSLWNSAPDVSTHAYQPI